MLRRSLAIPLLICALPLALAACGKASGTDPRTEIPLVRSAIVQPAALASRSFTGTVAARVQSDLGFRVSGKVMERMVDAGQTVKRGQVLMRLDSSDLKLAQQAQQEAVAAAKARAQQASDDEARYRDLRGTGAISASAYDQAKALADAANAQLRAANAQADVARNASQYAELRADGDGVILETIAEPGQVVNAGQAVIRLAHAGRREAIIQLPETLRPPVGSTAQASLFGREGAAVTAKLRQLSSTADRVSRTFEARYVLDGELADAPLGATVTLQLLEGAESAKDHVSVPVGALFDSGQGPGVWIIQGDTQSVHWTPVIVGRMTDEHVSVKGALKQGDRVVALGAHLLREGNNVRLAQGTAAVATTANNAATQGSRP
jgi:RND family efflux transporter MFP subunit